MEEEYKTGDFNEVKVSYTEISNCKDKIKELFPEIVLLKHWNKYSIMLDNTKTRYIVVRKPNFWYKLRTTLILPFIFLPYCFRWGYVNVRLAIRESYKGCFTVAQGMDEEIYNKLKEFANASNK